MANEAPCNLVMFTRIQEKVHRLRWTVQNFSRIPGTVRSSFFALVSGHAKNWQAAISAPPHYKFCNVTLSRACDDGKNVRVKYDVQITDSNGKILRHVQGSHLYIGTETFSLVNIDSEFALPRDKLHVKCSMVVHGYDTESTTSHFDDERINPSVLELQNNYKNMMENDEDSDICLNIGSGTLKAHKSILKYRAPKFVSKHQAGFDKGTITIKEDHKLFKMLLGYIYTAEVCDYQLEFDAPKLYELARTYQLEGLQRICARNMAVGLCVDNVCDTILLAETHRDEDLTRSVHDFMVANYDKMADRPEWVNLIRSRPNLEAEIIHQLGSNGSV